MGMQCRAQTRLQLRRRGCRMDGWQYGRRHKKRSFLEAPVFTLTPALSCIDTSH